MAADHRRRPTQHRIYVDLGEFRPPCGVSSPALTASTEHRNEQMTERTSASWLVYVLGALCTGAVGAALLVVGPASGSETAVTRTAKAAQGVVQSTVSGSGTLAPATKVGVNFAT